MSAWLEDIARDPVRFPWMTFGHEWAVAYQRERVRIAIERMEQGLPNDFPFAWRDYKDLMRG